MSYQRKVVALAFGLLGASMLTQRKKRRSWVKNWLQRADYGELRLVRSLRDYPEDFKNFLRMDEEMFEELLRLTGPRLQKKDTVMRTSISPRERLIATLRYLATGSDYEDLKFSTKIAAQTLGKIIPETCEVIVESLSSQYLKMPTSASEWKEEAKKFKEKWHFINCGGAIDGKHIRIKKPNNTGSLYFNYKKFYSVVLMGIVNADYEFLYVDVGKQGRLSDGGVIECTTFFDGLRLKKLNLPTDNEEGFNFVFVGDEAFALHENILKPFSQKLLTKERRVFNYRLSRARNVVENAFGLMAARFKILGKSISIEPEKVNKVVMAICVLHKFLMRKSRAGYASSLDKENPLTHEVQIGSWRNESPPLESLAPGRARDTEEAKKNRENYVHYFNNKGRVPWQDNMV